ncbi:MAG: hypothetical protein KC503_30890 [Myxococcales bacterium]|nr:hypothetical protein [Myxococcales bacterium]
MRILAFCAALLAVPSPALAARTIAVLTFGGDDGASARTRIVSALSRRYTVLDGDKILDACDELGIKMSRGRNLARAAQHVGAVAVIGGRAADGRLALAIYSGADGEPIVAKAIPWGSSVRYLRKALSVILVALAKAPKRVGKARTKPKPVPTPLPPDDPKPAVAVKSGKDDPDPISFDPDPVGKSPPKKSNGGGSQSGDPDEDPLSLAPANKIAAKSNNKAGSGDAAAKTDAKVEKKKKDDDRRTRVVGTVGLGTWMRSFALNDPVPGRTHPEYGSGAAFALRVAAEGRPLSFFTSGIPANFYARFRFTTTLGLSSKVADPNQGGAQVALSTSMNEWLLDFGYDFLFGDKETSPDLSIGIGYGGLGFGIDWTNIAPSLPNSAYGFVLITADFRWPFLGWLGLHVHFDYRVVTGSGEIENTDPDRWYGPASAGGIAFGGGLQARLKGFVITLDYTYTRFFYAFTDAANRQAANQRAAGGALDVYNAIVVSGGYSF